ncbi:MAG: TonB-dependent receptor [bacterium]|nr:TonB-dependent receptor [bacterium]
MSSSIVSAIRSTGLLIALFTLCMSTQSIAAATLSGRVIDADTTVPLTGARIILPGDEDLEFACDASGTFAIPDLPNRSLMVIVSHLGYDTFVKLIDPVDYLTTPLLIELVPTFYRGEKVVVSGSRYSPEIHLTLSNLTSEDLARNRSERDIPVLLAATVPGLHASSDAGNGVGYTYINLRGFDQRRVGVMVNGIPLNDPEDHQVYWVDLPDLASSLEDIQVQRGVTNSLGGMSAIGGTVNLVTSVLSAEAGGQLSLSVGSFGTAKQTLSWQTGLLGGRFASSFRISHLESDGFRDRSASDQWSAFWSGRFITPQTATQVNIYSGHEVTHQAWYGIDQDQWDNDYTANPITDTNAVDDFRQPHYELHHRWNLADNMVLRNSVYFIKGDGFYENYKDGRNPTDFGLESAEEEVNLVRRKTVDKYQVGLVSRLLIDHKLGQAIIGGDIYDFHSRHYGTVMHVDGVDPADMLDRPDYYRYTGDKLAWSLYLNNQTGLGEQLTLLTDLHFQRKSYDFMQEETGNFRGDLRNAYNVAYDHFNPKVGLFWQIPGQVIGGELGMYVNAGIARREPTDSDLFDAWDGPDDLGAQPLFARCDTIRADGEVDYLEWRDPYIKEEKVLNYEIGMAWRGEQLSFTLNGYRMEFENEIVNYGGLNDEGHAIKGNAARTLHQGIELGLTARIGQAHTLKLAASRSWDEYSEFSLFEDIGEWVETAPGEWEFQYVRTDEHDYAGHPIALFPEYLGAVALESDFGQIRSHLRWRCAGKQYLDNTGNDERTIEAYNNLDAGVSCSLGLLGLPELGSAWIEASVRNALDVKYATSGYFDGWEAGNYFMPAATRNFLLGVHYEF